MNNSTQISPILSPFVQPSEAIAIRPWIKAKIKHEFISITNLHRVQTYTKLQIPYPLETVAAGLPSPAQDYVEKRIDLNTYLIHNPLATFILKVNSLSMKNAGIEIGDEILIDRSIDAAHGDIVLALLNNEFTVKRFIQQKSATGIDQKWLKAENPDFPNIYPSGEEQIIIWGVVTCILKRLK